MKILVTGGSGFIGSHLVEKLITEGHTVLVLDNHATGREINLNSLQGNRNYEFQFGSILDLALVKTLAKDCDYIFHLAAAVGVFNIVNHPLDSLLTNIRGTENVLEAAHAASVPIFVTSSSEVYGKNTSNSLKETDDRVIGSPTTLRWSYSEAKAIDESLTHAYFIEKSLVTRTVRFFNTVGPRQVGSYGMVVPRFIESALNNDPLTVYGDGKQTRCFAHIYDVIDAVYAVAFSDKTIGKVINIGNNFEISIADLAKKIIEQTNSKSKIEFVPYLEAYGNGFEDMERRVPNIDLIEELVGWQPKRDLVSIINDIATEMRKSS